MWQVVQPLALSLDGQDLPAPSASVQARQRLGSEPLEHLFRQLAQAWSRPGEGSELRVLAVGGVVWSAPDTPENRPSLGSGSTQYGALPWPQVRAVCLLDTHPHELLNTANLASPATLPAYLGHLLQQARYFVLPPRRSTRSCPREAKHRAHKFPTKNASQR